MVKLHYGSVCMIQNRLLHVYAHLMFRALLEGLAIEFDRLGLYTYKVENGLLYTDRRFYANYMVWQIICVHLCYYKLDFIG